MDESAQPVNYGGDYGIIRTIHHATLLYSPQSQLLSNIDPCSLRVPPCRGGGGGWGGCGVIVASFYSLVCTCESLFMLRWKQVRRNYLLKIRHAIV